MFLFLFFWKSQNLLNLLEFEMLEMLVGSVGTSFYKVSLTFNFSVVAGMYCGFLTPVLMFLYFGVSL